MWTFTPILKHKVWGGNRILSFKELDSGAEGIGESWEISDIPGSESVVCGGKDAGKTLSQLVKEYGADLLGARNYRTYGDSFPLLVKFIDARDRLSVQVHPDRDTAARYGFPRGKAEMWYVVDAEKNSGLINGLNGISDAENLRRSLSEGTIMQQLNMLEARPGDAFYIPAGRVHALGEGILVCEIQESSDVTFRIYDYDRPDTDGKLRELHVEEACESIDFVNPRGGAIDYVALHNVPVRLVSSPFFTTNLLQLSSEIVRDYSELDTFVILVATAGRATVSGGTETISLRQGDSLLIPASARGVTITPEGDFSALETFIN
ncbi:MAG: class I mannose-6-phosphate isomerase [Muribaculaceae bacterium]|nr:class I mannose-6-phosphate isomerase [Muribaculaceae bacterium]